MKRISRHLTSWSELVDTSGTPNEQARRLLFLLFPIDVAESFYREFGDIVAAARAQLSVELLNRQAAAMDAWHRNGVASQLREIRVPVLIATGTEDIVIPASNALKLVNAIPGAWLAQFPHGGHAFIAQYPRALADLINSFLALSTAHNARVKRDAIWWHNLGHGPPSRTPTPSANLLYGCRRSYRFLSSNRRLLDARPE